MAQYAAIRQLPPRLLRSAVKIEQQRQHEAEIRHGELLAVAADVGMGKRYVDPKNPHGNRDSDTPYYTLEPFQRYMDQLKRIARPWEYTEAAIIRRREREEAVEFAALERAMSRGIRA